MCRFKKLCQTGSGYVVRCHQCRHIHVAYGTTILAYTHDQYHEFVRTVNDQYSLYKNDCAHDRKIIQIATDARSITLVYTFRELEKLCSMLEKANEAMDKEKLFSFHDN